MLLLKTSKRTRGSKKVFRINIERILFLSFIITFVLLVIVQAALVHPAVRTFLTVDRELEGTPLKAEEFLYKEGEIALQVLKGEYGEGLKVLVNGDVAAAFADQEVSLKVKDGDVVEIDASGLEGETEVGIVSCSSNISPEYVNKTVKVGGNIKSLAKIKVQ